VVPFIGTAGRAEDEADQHSVRDLRSVGILPDILLCRTDRRLPATSSRRSRSSATCPRRPSSTARDVETIYELPLLPGEEHLDDIILKYPPCTCRTTGAAPGSLADAGRRIKDPDHDVAIHVVGKYVELTDSYKSLNEALYHGGFARRARIRFSGSGRGARAGGRRASADGAHGILVPGGFGLRGTRA